MNQISENKNIKIPKEYRVIAIRANRGNKSPMGFSEEFNDTGYIWPDSGPAYPLKNTHGLYGILLFQKFSHLELIQNYVPYPNYLILEVDKRKITGEQDFEKRTHLESIEVEFSECNVLFNGQLPEFLIELEKYTTPEQLKKVCDFFSRSLLEILASRESPEKREEYILRVKMRCEWAQESELLHNVIETQKQLLNKIRNERTTRLDS